MRLVSMTNKHEFEFDAHLVKQRAMTVAKSMMIQLRIPSGDHLLFILGHPEAVDNQYALYKWILTQEPRVALSSDSYIRLTSKLKRVLSDAETGEIQ